MMGRLSLKSTLAITLLAAFASLAFGQSQDRPQRPGAGYRWVDGQWVNAPAPPDTAWTAGFYAHDGNWIPGHFQYVGKVPEGKAWVPGHWRNGEWVRGSFRELERKNFVWVDGYHDSELGCVRGRWDYVGPPKRGYTWVPGHWSGKRWLKGHWRNNDKPGRIWVDGHRGKRGSWIPGHWRRQR